MNTLTTSQTPLTNIALAKAKAKKAVRKIVTVSTGDADFGVDTKLIRNVVQIGDAVFSDNRQSIVMGDEKISVVLLKDFVDDSLDEAITPEADAGNTLLIVRSPSRQKSLAIRVDSVSRPIVVENENFYALPSCVFSNQQNEFVESLAVTNSETDDFELRLIINPLKPFGLDDQQAKIEKSVGRLAKPAAVANGSKGQMVVFAPAGVGTDLNFQLCLPLPFVAEIIQTDEKSMMGLPMSLPKLTGMVIWRDIPVPVIDLAGQFNLDRVAEKTSDSRLMVCHLGQGQHVAFYTQVQIKTLRTPDATQTDTAWLHGLPKLAAVESEYGVLVVPDLKSILNS